MDRSLIILGLLAVAPLILAVVLRVSSVYFFVSVVAGGLLVEHLGDDAILATQAFVKDKDPALVVHLALLLVPVALTLLLLRGTLKASRFMLEIIPLTASAATLIVLTIPLLSDSVRAQVTATQYGQTIGRSQSLIISGAVVLNLLLMWVINKNKPEARSHHKRR